MHIVVALGGNALLRRGEPLRSMTQQVNAAHAAAAIAALVRLGHRVTLTHGNGPQVGLLALQAAAGPPEGAPPLDDLGAESEGWIGYVLEQELANALPPGTECATLLTRVEVDAADPAFTHPSKPIGPVYDEATAKILAAQNGWAVAPDGKYWRRVVASPLPLRILNAASILCLTQAGMFVICAGGGGIPVRRDTDGKFHGAEAVIDKDYASAVLAQQIGADMLLMLTDVDAVYENFGSAAQKPVAALTLAQAAAQKFAAGSMGPKILAARNFVQNTGKCAAIGRLEDAAGIITGRAGTRILPG